MYIATFAYSAASHQQLSIFFFTETATPEIYTLSLHDALPICRIDPQARTAVAGRDRDRRGGTARIAVGEGRSEEHTSELQSRRDLVCRLLLEKKKKNFSVGAYAVVIIK